MRATIRVTFGVLERFEFLFRKQRCHPGFSLHLTCSQLCQRAADVFSAGSAIDQEKEDAVRQAAILAAMKGTGGAFLETDHGTNTRAANDSQRSDYVARNLASLSTLYLTTERFVEWSRDKIAKRFVDELEPWFLGSGGQPFERCYVVTAGYSKTVRTVIKQGFALLEQRSQRDGPVLPKVFVMAEKGQDQPDTQKMLYELTEDSEYPRREVASGNEMRLHGLLESGDRVLFVLGAESFRGDRRVIHPRFLTKRLKKLRRVLALAQVQYKVVFVAESYKRFDNPPLKNHDLWCYHLQFLEQYDGRHISLIVTDDGVLSSR